MRKRNWNSKSPKHLTEEQREMAIATLNNEIKDVMVSIDIISEELDRTAMFKDLNMRNIAADYINQRLKFNPDGSYDEKLLQYVFEWYFPQ